MLTNTDGNYLNPGSWVKSPQPVFKSNAANGVYGTGGQDFFKSPDGREDWMVYHATNIATGNCGSGRSARVGKVSWLADGTPYLHSPAAEGTPYPVPGNGILIPDGVYRLTNVSSGNVMSTNGCSGNNSTLINHSAWNGQDCQRWLFTHVGDGFYKIANRITGKVLDNTSCGAEDGNPIQLWDYVDNDCQKWKIVQISAGVIRLVNRGNGKALQITGAQVVLNTVNANTTQQWQFNEVSSNFIADGDYRIRLVKNNKVLHPANNVDARGSITTQSDWTGNATQIWKVRATADGWYRVHSSNNIALDVDVCNSTEGGKVQIWDSLNNNCQHWGFSVIEAGKWALVNRNSKKVLNSPGTTNGAAVNQWTWQRNANQIWFVEAPPSSARSVTPVKEFTIIPNGTQLQLTVRTELAQPATVIVYDAVGRMVFQQKVTIQYGLNRFVLSPGVLLRGTYHTTILFNNNQKESRKIVIQ